MRTLSMREKIIALCCLFVCAAFAVKILVVDNFWGQNQALETRIQLAEKKIAQAKATLKQAPVYERALKEMTDRFGVAASEGTEFSQMTDKINAGARDANIRVLNIQPLKSRQEKYYKAYPVDVMVDGTWKGVARFLYLMQSSKNLLDVEQMNLQKTSDAALGGKTASLRGRIIFSRIRLKALSK